ncbi:putative GIY-YIG superfamily endonuclease [Pseudomonas sp. JAI115]|uniref:GIY-YIG nuclease family protein n=1 Tax=Pseudomonas sp. JAI115 TaxID=2723061 RepID=UPI00161114CF|nr:GIY-YIG nuclease family protein [Pseudomonas sp. JAI115]MBB6154949.1 putative GIY-YIG superfamily endonuclease [Pseudomonas sp. JAI115]
MDWKLERCLRYLYVLELENGKYYVGQAKDPDRRIRKHFNGSGSEWTRMHRPVRELSRQSLDDVDYRTGELAENELVLQLMRQHGYHNVRGGFFANTSSEHIEKNLLSHGHGSIISDVSSLVDFTDGSGLVSNYSSQAPMPVMCGADYSLFVLKLEDEHYFVGYSTKPDVRIKRHFAGKGADWTALHKPVEVVTTRSLGFITETEAASKTADATLALMRLFGWRKVRGGTWKSIDEAATLSQLRLSGYRYT